jgi:hypothetical protein
MTQPTGYVVTLPTRQRQLFLDQARAEERAAAQSARSVNALYTLHQIVTALEEKGAHDTEAAEAVDAVLNLGLKP